MKLTLFIRKITMEHAKPSIIEASNGGTDTSPFVRFTVPTPADAEKFHVGQKVEVALVVAPS